MSEEAWSVPVLMALAFTIGLNVGGWVADRLNRKRLDAEAELGRTFNQFIDQTIEPLRFTGKGARVTQQAITTRNGVTCKITFEAEQGE